MICLKLIELGINPDIIVEPTCGVGNFIEASSHLFPSVRKIIGVEVNRHYIGEMTTKNQFIQDQRIELQQADFFSV
jgi:tRNA/tmRNA/rRNA uracil-C5-methylase (TrmA/RlmC/RlmD family)